LGVQRARPCVKWAGGKSQLLAALEQHWPPAGFDRYIEPFLGGGAVYFHLAPRRALLSDANAELIETWTVVRDQVEALIRDLERHPWDEAYYYELRSVDPRGLSSVERASRFIFLNKTCYNGLYRVNRSGQFNVPFGRYKKAPSIYDAENLRAASALLRFADLRVADFEATMADAGPGDFIYLDPPYDPVSATANFTHYTEGRFDAHEQRRLADAVAQATRQGAFVLLNNSDTEFIRSLFPAAGVASAPGLMAPGAYTVCSVETNRAINSDATKRKGAYELVVTNYRP
jgi:DNA adenine methylase